MRTLKKCAPWIGLGVGTLIEVLIILLHKYHDPAYLIKFIHVAILNLFAPAGISYSPGICYVPWKLELTARVAGAFLLPVLGFIIGLSIRWIAGKKKA